jgi:ribonuclease HI
MEYLDDDALNIYTDGSSKLRPRRGGIGIRYVVTGESGKEDVHDYGDLPGYRESTNNEMELWAAVMALKIARGPRFPVDLRRLSKIVIRTDSLYLKDNFNHALYSWRPSWRKRDGSPVENAELWDKLLDEWFKAPLPVAFDWIKGKTSVHAKAVDRFAKDSADNALHPPLTARKARRKTSGKPLEQGSVPMRGQILDVLVVNQKWNGKARMHRYTYQVLSKGPDFDKVDVAHTGLLLDANHWYRVRMNDQGKARIEEVICELDRATGEPVLP